MLQFDHKVSQFEYTIACINKKTVKFCACESIQWKFSESIQWVQIDLIVSGHNSIGIDSNRINMPALMLISNNW